ncbi:MAG: hypothetical protein IPF54_01350 [Draconibacterium sp.]|nr:hypothetical protein [Draconibacterium sp.]
MDKNPSSADKFTAEELIKDLKLEWNIDAKIGKKENLPAIVLTRNQKLKSVNNQGYQIISDEKEIIVKANGEDGLFLEPKPYSSLFKKIMRDLKFPVLP